MPKDLYAVMTGDLVNYSKAVEDERMEYIQNLKDILEKLHKSNRFMYETYRGDSFQAVYQTPREALRLVLLIRSYVISHCLKARKSGSQDVRIGLGIGPIYNIDKNAISHSDGEAFRNSGPLLDGMNKMRQRFLIKTPWPDVNKEFDTECALLDTIIRRWTADQAEAMYYYLQNHNQKEIAEILKIKQAAVSLRLNGANYWAVQKLIDRYVELIDKNVVMEHLIFSNLEFEDDAEENLKNTLSLLEEKLKQYPESVDLLLDTAQQHYKLHQYNKARDVVLHILQKQPENGDAHHILGMIYLSDGELNSAEREMRAAIQYNKDSSRDHICLGNILMRQERFEEAKKSLKTAAGLEPDKPYVQFLLGMAYHMLGDKEKAKESLSKAHELTPNLPSPHSITGVFSRDFSGDAAR